MAMGKARDRASPWPPGIDPPPAFRRSDAARRMDRRPRPGRAGRFRPPDPEPRRPIPMQDADGPPPGQHDYGDVRLTHHALRRFVERFGADPKEAEPRLRG